LLVGAPTANATNFHPSDSNKPGGLYKCDVSTRHNDCQSVQIDKSGKFLSNMDLFFVSEVCFECISLCNL